MEIFSYVGGRPDYRQKSFNYICSSRGKRRNYFKGIESNRVNYNSSLITLVTGVKKSFVKIADIFCKICEKLRKRLIFVPAIALLCTIPYFANKIYSYFEGKTNPLVLQNPLEDEFEFLNTEMQKFALQTFSDVNEDGSIQGMEIEHSLIEPVKYTKYTVKPGDTISGISKKFSLRNISTIIAVNNIENVRTLYSGKKLLIPSIDGLFYKVKSGDTISSISEKYNISINTLLDVNDLDSDILTNGTELFIPGAKLDKVTLRNAMGDTFVNPLKNAKWRLSSKCGWRPNPFTGVRQYHPGIDMAIAQGTPIYAALAGKVVACGWSNVYGNYVIIDHGNGYQSLYGHMHKKNCTINQEVTTNTKIGSVGSTGYSTGPHLHFTVYKNGKVVDPLTLLK